MSFLIWQKLKNNGACETYQAVKNWFKVVLLKKDRVIIAHVIFQDGFSFQRLGQFYNSLISLYDNRFETIYHQSCNVEVVQVLK